MSTFNNISKNSSTASNASKNSSTASNLSKSLVGATTATAGQAMGLLLALTYSGNQILVAGSSLSWSNLTKN